MRMQGNWVAAMVGMGFALGAYGCAGKSDAGKAPIEAGGGGETATPADIIGGAGADQGKGGGVDEPGMSDKLAVQRAAERRVTDSTVLPSQVAGAYRLTGSLCPSEQWFEVADYHYADKFTMPGFIVRRVGQSDELELVTYTRAEGKLEIQVHPLVRAGLGFDAENVETCATTGPEFEAEAETLRYEASHVHLVFEATDKGELHPIIAATNNDGPPVVSSTDYDHGSPRAIRLSKFIDHVYEDTPIAYPFGETFAFDKPAWLDDSYVHVVDGGSTPAYPPLLEDHGLGVGFRVTDILSSDVRLELKLTSLFGPQRHENAPYPGVSLPPLDGSFEGPPKFLSTDDFSWPDDPSSECAWASDDPDIYLTPLEGEHSFFLAPSCDFYFRASRPAGAKQLSIDGQRVTSDAAGSSCPVHLTVSSLGVGGDDFKVDLSPSWKDDPSLSSDDLRQVSEPQTLTFDLPETGSDLLLQFQAECPVWIDSLRFE